MILKIVELEPFKDQELEAGYDLLQVLHQDGFYRAVLQKVVPTPALAELVEAAASCPSGQAVGMPGELLRQALGELGYAVPEPSPIQLASADQLPPNGQGRG